MGDGIVTTEVRWFQDGELPVELTEWLASGALGPHAPATRSVEDLYLWTGRDDLSLKLRGSDLERKDRRSRRRLSQAGIEGWVERWEKNSRTKEPNDEVRSLTTIVHKRRRSLIFGEHRSQLIPLDDVEGAPPCVVELVALHVPGQHAWSLCLEANEGHEGLVPALVNHVMQSFPSPHRGALTATQSMGYPGWLAVHGRQPRMSDRKARAALPSLW